MKRAVSIGGAACSPGEFLTPHPEHGARWKAAADAPSDGVDPDLPNCGSALAQDSARILAGLSFSLAPRFGVPVSYEPRRVFELVVSLRPTSALLSN
jgi:hypothetical protein